MYTEGFYSVVITHIIVLLSVFDLLILLKNIVKNLLGETSKNTERIFFYLTIVLEHNEIVTCTNTSIYFYM